MTFQVWTGYQALSATVYDPLATTTHRAHWTSPRSRDTWRHDERIRCVLVIDFDCEWAWRRVVVPWETING